jgi:hypothetical protein
MLVTAASENQLAIECFAQLAERAACEERTYLLGGCYFRLRYLDQRLVPLVHRSIAHVECERVSSPDFVLHLFVDQRAPIRFSHERWLEASRALKSERVRPDRLYAHLVPGEAGRLDLLLGERCEGCVCYRSPERMAAWDVATPLRDILQACMRLHDAHIVHGALLADDDAAVLLAGAGGSGKSNTALTCLRRSNLKYLGDDLCVVRRHGQEIYGHSLYNSAKLRPHDVARYAALELPQFDDSARGDGKPTFFLFPSLRERLAISRPLKGVLLPRVRPGEHSALTSATATETWKAIGPSTHALIPGDDEGWKWLMRLAQDVIRWRLELGTRREEIPPLVEQVLQSGAALAAA